MELDLFDGLTEEIAAFFLLPKRAVGWRSPCVNSSGSSRSSSLVGVTFPTRILPWLHAWPKRATARACLWCWVMWGAVRGQSKRGPGCVRVCVARPLLHDSSCLSAIKGAWTGSLRFLIVSPSMELDGEMCGTVGGQREETRQRFMQGAPVACGCWCGRVRVCRPLTERIAARFRQKDRVQQSALRCMAALPGAFSKRRWDGPRA